VINITTFSFTGPSLCWKL